MAIVINKIIQIMNDDLERVEDNQLNERLLDSLPSKDLLRKFDIDEEFKSGERLDQSPVLIKFASSPPNFKISAFDGNHPTLGIGSQNEIRGSNVLGNKEFPKKLGTPALDRLGSSNNSMQGTIKKDSFTAGLNAKGFGPPKDKSEMSIHSKYEEKKREKLTTLVLLYNCFENFVLFLMMLNSVIYPSGSSATYFITALVLTLFSLKRDEKTVQIKFIIGIVLLVITIALTITKGVILILLNNEGTLVLNSDQRYFYDSMGIRIDQKMDRIKVYNTFMTISFDIIQVFLSAALTAFYFSIKKDCKKIHTSDEHSAYLLHPFFERNQETLCVFALVVLSISTIFVQTIIQSFILILMLLLFAAWANEQHEKNSFRLLILNFVQVLMLLQISITFIFQVAIISKELFITDLTFVWDMFGFLLHNLSLYQVVLHLLTMCLSIQAIQLYKGTRASSFKSHQLLPAEGIENDEYEKRSDDRLLLRSAKKRFGGSYERSKTFGSAFGRLTMKPSIVDRFKEKTQELRFKQQNESSIMMVAKINYRDFSPQIWFFICRFTAFIWCYAYHDFQSWILLAWIMHSTIFQSMKRFYYQTVTYYLPFFLMTFMFYYIINIPRVVEFQTHKASFDTWLALGFYQYSIPPLEITLMMLGLCPFFFLIKSKKYLSFNKEEQKVKLLEKLTRKESPTVFYMLFLVITNLDLIVFLAIFFSGVNKIDFYHVFLMFFFVAYITAPLWFKKNYIYLLYYVTFFVFEKYLFTLIEIYIPENSELRQFLDVLGLSTNYDEKSDSKYFRYPPKFQQWGLIIAVFLQYQVHKLLQDEKSVQKFEEDVQANFKERYPRVAYFLELLWHMKKEFLILLTFTIFFVIIIFSDKNIINWGFQIIICIFIVAYVGYGHHIVDDNGIKRLQRVWFLIIWYASFVLIVQITFQFAALPFVRKSLHLDYVLDLLPLWLRKNLPLIGFKVYKKYIWEQFLIYLMYFAIGHYVRSQIVHWNLLDKKAKNIELADQPSPNNSDILEVYDDNQNQIDWKTEFMKIRFSTPYLVYKVRKIWVIVDKCSQLIFLIISLIIMILATHWQISLAMAIHLTCFLGFCLQIAQKLYQNRKQEKKALKARNVDQNHAKYRRNLSIEECHKRWDEYKIKVNNYQVKIRQNVWLFQFVITLLCIALIYPSEFIFYVRKTFNDEGDHPDVVTLLDYITFYLFWVGVYHCPEQGHGYFYNVYGYLIILVLLVFEKNAQQWALDRFGCTIERQEWFWQIEENINKKPKSKQQIMLQPVKDQIIEEEQENEDQDESVINIRKKKLHQPSSHFISESKSQIINNESSIAEDRSIEYHHTNPDEIKKQLKKWITKNYILKLLSGFKILLEETIQLLLLISSVYKDSVVGMVLLFGVFLYMIRRKIKTIQRLAWITGFSMIIQYGLSLSNLTSTINPMQFPKPFDPYPSPPDDEGQFIIPWFLKIPFLSDSYQWQIYLSMGVNSSKLNSIWIDYIIMGCIQAELLYFGCQLFSIDLKVSKGDDLKEMFNRYVQIVAGNQLPKTVKYETHKLKRQCFAYSFYKGAQMTLFMNFHQITIVVTLLLAILARSLLSFGYITVCMIMIYENHKYFLPKKEINTETEKKNINFPLHKVLKYWLQPYVFFDITIQMIFQIPLEFLHRGQDAPNSWQNIIGLQDIWVESAGQVSEVANKSLIYIILKAFTYYFVTLQIQVFESKAYHKYMNKDFKKYTDMAEEKGRASMWRANNFKINQIRTQQQEKNKMDDMLKNLKKVLTKWQVLLNQDLNQQIQVVFDKTPKTSTGNTKEPFNAGNQKVRKSLSKVSNLLEDVSIKETHRSFVENPTKDNKLLRANTKPRKFLKNEPSERASTFLPQISENEDEFFDGKSDHELLLLAIGKLNIFVRLLIWTKKNLTDQIVFISSKKYLEKVTEQMKQGKTNIYSKLERRMLVDIREIRKKKILETLQDIDVKEMKRTQEQIKFRKVFQGYIRLFGEIVVTYSDSICYILMIVSMMKNAGFISLLYPFVVFGYALMEEINPKKRIWYMLMIYTQILIIIKFVFQLSYWEAFYSQLQIDQFQDKINGIHVGLTRIKTDDFGKMLAYFLPEILILLAIMTHIQKEIMTGILFLKENPMENIQEAIIRYLRFNSDIFTTKKHQSLLLLNNSVIPRNLNKDKEMAEDLKSEEFIVSQMQSIDLYKESIFQEDLKLLKLIKRSNSLISSSLDQSDIISVKTHEPRATSLVDRKNLRKISKILMEKEILDEVNLEMIQTKTYKHKTITLFQRIFYQNSYFEKLFPSVKEQKPGKDLYALMATFQSVLCIFMIFFYTKMDADVTNISDQLTYNQFSGQMVVALFLQILVMIIDRYLYKSKTFIQVQEEIEDARIQSRAVMNNQSVINNSIKIEEFQSPNKFRHDESSVLTPAKHSQPIKVPESDKTSKKIKIMEQIRQNKLDDSKSSKSTDTLEQERAQLQEQYKFENTKVTLAMVSKYYLQIFLILLVHSFVFWFFPIYGNIKLQNYPYCVTKTSQSKEKIACNEFGDNWALVLFYLLYCCYFWISALQIRYGVAEMKKGNFLMNSYHIVNYVAFKGFMAIPFIFELKTFIDWTFSKTALDVFQWFNLSNAHAELYIAHSLQGRMQGKPLGRPIKSFQKVILGFCGQVMIILLIAGPLLLFSTFNPISTPDPVINAQIQFNILLEPKASSARNTINVFTNNYVTTIRQIQDIQYDQMRFAFDPRTKSFDKEFIQFIKMNNFPDTSWGVSQPNKAYMREEFQAAVDNKSDTNIYFQLQYEFDRQKQSIQPAKADWVYNLTEPVFRGALMNFTKIFNLDCQGGKSNQSQQVSMKNIFTGVHFLNDYDDAITADNKEWMKGLFIVYSCKGDYWTVDQLLNQTSYEAKLPSSKQPGIAFFTFSTKTSPSYFKYSVITFYLSIVLVISKLIRNVLVIGGNRIFIFEIPRAEPLLQLCECVYIYRMRAQLDKEEQLYFTFMDIMRSPEMIKAITGSALKKKTD